MEKNIDLLTDETLNEVLDSIEEIPEDAEVSYEVWALGYYDEGITDVELLLGTFEDPDAAVQYASIIQLADIEEHIRTEQLDEFLLKDLSHISIEVETVIDTDEDESMNVGTVYARKIHLDKEDIIITAKDYRILEGGNLIISKNLLKDFNKNDMVKIKFDGETDKPVLTFKIVSKVLYESGEYYHLDFMF
jgi:hypothetical protein